MSTPDDLINGHFDHGLDEAHGEELSRWVEADPRHARQMVEHAFMHHQLSVVLRRLQIQDYSPELHTRWLDDLRAMECGAEEAGLVEVDAGQTSGCRVKRAGKEDTAVGAGVACRVVLPWLAIAACLGLAVVLVEVLWLDGPTPQQASPGHDLGGVPGPDEGAPGLEGVARVIRSYAVSWDQTETVRGGEVLRADQTFSLTEGLLELELGRGARVVLEAPCVARVMDSNTLLLERGRLMAYVPERASGFVLRTPTAALNRGSRFGVSVEPDGATRTDVFGGEVLLSVSARPGIAQEPGRSSRHLTAGQARRVSIDGWVREMEFDDRHYVKEDELSRLDADPADPYARWLAGTIRMRRRSDVVAYFVPEYEPVQMFGVVENWADDADYDGRVHGLGLGPGRFVEKPALQFDDPAGYLAVELPQAMTELTLMAWVWVAPGQEQVQMSLLMSNGWDRPDAVHWQLEYEKAGVSWSYRRAVSQNEYVGQALVRDVVPTGRWIQLVTTVSGSTESVRTYINGRLVDDQPLEIDFPVRIGSARFGNWQRGHEYPQEDRSFTGRVDELVVFSRALPTNEIIDLYDSGRP